jgi:hypothetical protein
MNLSAFCRKRVRRFKEISALSITIAPSLLPYCAQLGVCHLWARVTAHGNQRLEGEELPRPLTGGPLSFLFVSVRDTVQTQHKHIPRQRNGHHTSDSEP